MASEKFLDSEGLAHVLRRFKETYTSLQTVQFKMQVPTISTLPPLSDVKIGWMYSIETGGKTTADFVEGAGQTLNDGESVIAVNVGTEEEIDMKWDAVGGIFDISDRLQFGNTFPSLPSIGDTFLYMGENVYDYILVTPVGNENPKEKGWYEYNSSEDIYVPSMDTEVDVLKQYYKQVPKYEKGIIYVYSIGNIWAPQPYGDTVTSIDFGDIAALFA